MNKQVFAPSKSKLGDMDAKYVVLIAYLGSIVLGFIPGVQYVAWLVPLIIFFLDKENKFIAFHAMQSFLLGVVAAVIYIILAIVVGIATIGATAGAYALNAYGFGAGLAVIAVTGVIAVIVAILVLIMLILATVKGYKYEIYEIPLVGKLAEKIVFKTSN